MSPLTNYRCRRNIVPEHIQKHRDVQRRSGKSGTPQVDPSPGRELQACPIQRRGKAFVLVPATWSHKAPLPTKKGGKCFTHGKVSGAYVSLFEGGTLRNPCGDWIVTEFVQTGGRPKIYFVT